MHCKSDIDIVLIHNLIISMTNTSEPAIYIYI